MSAASIIRSASIGALIGVPMLLSATTIVGIWTEKQVTIAADSKQTMMEGTTVVGSRSACKMYEVRNLIFALAGLAESDGISVVEDIRNSKVLRNQDTGVALADSSLIVGAISAIEKVFKAHRTGYGPDLTVEFLFAGMIDGKLQMYRVEMSGMQIQGDYAMPKSMRQYRFPESRGYSGTDRNRAFEVIGISDAVERFKAVLPNEWNKGDDRSVARRLVGIEAADSLASRFVGAPISTIVIDKKSARWIDKGVCEWNPSTSRRR